MKKQKYLHVSASGEDNIAVLDIGKIDILSEKVADTITAIAEPKMVKALKEYFDCEIRVISIKQFSVLPIFLQAEVIVGAEEEDYQTTIFLNETWIY